MASLRHDGPAEVLRTYFHAKDENRPHLMRAAFSQDAVLRMQVHSDAIAFPQETRGVDGIADVLVRRFGQAYDNVYSFYLDRPASDATEFSCDWLVGMSAKEGGGVRVGCGRYEWLFERKERTKARALAISIESMQVLPASQAQPVFSWLTELDSYPWTSHAEVLAAAPRMPELEPVLRYIARGAPA